MLFVALVGGFAASADRNDELVAALSSDDPEVRRAACHSIAQAEYNSYAIVPVAMLLDHDNPEVVRAARTALEGIVAGMSEDPGTREVASEAVCDAIDVVENDEWLFRILSFSGEPNVVPRLARMLDGKTDYHRVIMALQGIGRDEAASAMIARIVRSEEAERIALINALGEVGGDVAVAALLNQSNEPDPVGLAAIEALGNVATPRALPVIRERLESDDDPRVLAAYLKTVESQPPENAVQAYLDLFAESESAAVRAAALSGLGRTNSEAAIRPFLESLYADEPAIFGAAYNGLKSLESPEVDRVLLATYKSAGAEARGPMLEIMHARNPESARPLLDEALNHTDAGMRITALLLLGDTPDPKYESTFREAAESGADNVKPAALQGFLALAAQAQAGGDADKAVDMYHEALKLATRNEERLKALEGMGKAGKFRSLIVLQGLQDVQGIGAAVSRCAMAIADNIRETQPGMAQRVYEGIAERGEESLAMRAVQRLRDMGVDRDFAREAGFITNWRLIGPFANRGFDHALAPETEPYDSTAEYEGVGGQPIGWVVLKVESLRGITDLGSILQPNQEVIAYARAEVTVAKACDAQLLLGSDDGIAAWVNDESVHINDVDRGLQVDSDRVPIKLKEGANFILLKISQHGGGWAFCARLTDADGDPLEFEN